MQRLFAECLDEKKSKTPQQAHAQTNSSIGGLNVSLASATSSGLSYLAESIRSISEPLIVVLGRAGKSWIVWASTTVLLLVIFAPPLVARISAYAQTKRQIYTNMAEIFDEAKTLRSRPDETELWNEFRERTEAELAVLVPRLKRDAKITDKASMSLLWLGRDYLPSLLRDKTGNTADIEQRITAHLEVASAALQTRPAPPWSVQTTVLVSLDVMAACAALIYFGRILVSRHLAMS
jgi:hypothetical protein